LKEFDAALRVLKAKRTSTSSFEKSQALIYLIFYGEDEIFFLAFPETDFAPFIGVLNPNFLIEGRQLPIVDIAAPLGDYPPRFSPGSAQVRLVEQLESRYARLDPASFYR
jgi:hypothetical protein